VVRAAVPRVRSKENQVPGADLRSKTTSPTPVRAEPETETPGEANGAIPVPESPPVRRVVSILVLEDEDRVRSFLVEALTEAGHRVEAVSGALSGLAKLETKAFDVVLADLALPERSGLAVATAVKRLHPETPVILITGWGHVLDPDRIREQGVDLMLVKPFRADRALSLVSQALTMRATPQ
jgi:CheY-like chemotaxis protein